MRIVSLVDNVSCCGCAAEHGLSLYVVLDSGMRLLFDMGQGDLFARNAQLLGEDLSTVDVAVISHGHYDHGGGLTKFLEINTKAPVYIRRSAFEDHFSQRPDGRADIGLNRALEQSDRLVFTDARHHVGDGLELFSDVPAAFPVPSGSEKLLAGQSIQDTFNHEQSLVIRENDHTVLLAGCAHRGILNIMAEAECVAGCRLTHVFAGMHLSKAPQSEDYMALLASELKDRGAQYHTMHCTGYRNYLILKERYGVDINYLSCGQSVLKV